jgi:hypothetical protein
MKQYEKIFVPDIENGDYWAQDEQDESKPGYWLAPKENVIVLTVEELREVWQNGVFFGNGEGGNADQTDTKNFKTFLQSKGIKL